MMVKSANLRHTTSTLRVRYVETDQMGFVYHSHYLVWCDIGRTDFLRELGAAYAELERDGLILAVTDAQLRYHAPARYDDVIRVETWLERIQSRMLTFGYEIVRAEPEPRQRLVTASTTLIALDRQGRPRTLPPDLLSLLRNAQYAAQP
ncbi:MAG TPA: thioesterase family protein [Longimicrobiales bacterium]